MSTIKTSIFHVFHVVADHYQQFVAEVEQPRYYAGNVEAVSLNDAFMKTQNIEGNETWPHRSTSVGDVIQIEDRNYLVKGVGYELIEPSTLAPDAESNPGYTYVDSHGHVAHTWDFEESIGE